MTGRCRHPRQRVITLRDFSRRQVCSICGALVFKLAPQNWTDSELKVEAERRARMLANGWPLTPPDDEGAA